MHTYIHTYIHTALYVCMYVCSMHVCMYVVCMYVCMYAVGLRKGRSSPLLQASTNCRTKQNVRMWDIRVSRLSM